MEAKLNMRATISLIVGCLLLAACDSTTSPRFTKNGFTVEAADRVVSLQNESESKIHYVLVEEETSALLDLHFDPEAWPAVTPGEIRVVPYEEITGYSPEATEVRVHWWTRGEFQEFFIIGLR